MFCGVKIERKRIEGVAQLFKAQKIKQPNFFQKGFSRKNIALYSEQYGNSFFLKCG